MPYFFFRKWTEPDKDSTWLCIDTATDFSEAKVKQARYMQLEEKDRFIIHTEFGRTEDEARRGLKKARALKSRK